MTEVFDVPAGIGKLRWSTGWRDASSFGDRLFTTLVATLAIGGGGAIGVAHLLGDTKASPLYVVWFIVVAVLGWVFFGPDRHCMCTGERGASMSRRRFGVWTTREVLLYDEADDVELDPTRIVSDGVGQIYDHTKLEFAFIDREGYEVFSITGVIDEPEQRAQPKWNPTAPLQLDGPRDRGADFGFATMEAFHAFKDQRPIGPYR